MKQTQKIKQITVIISGRFQIDEIVYGIAIRIQGKGKIYFSICMI